MRLVAALLCGLSIAGLCACGSDVGTSSTPTEGEAPSTGAPSTSGAPGARGCPDASTAPPGGVEGVGGSVAAFASNHKEHGTSSEYDGPDGATIVVACIGGTTVSAINVTFATSVTEQQALSDVLRDHWAPPDSTQGSSQVVQSGVASNSCKVFTFHSPTLADDTAANDASGNFAVELAWPVTAPGPYNPNNVGSADVYLDTAQGGC